MGSGVNERVVTLARTVTLDHTLLNMAQLPCKKITHASLELSAPQSSPNLSAALKRDPQQREQGHVLGLIHFHIVMDTEC